MFDDIQKRLSSAFGRFRARGLLTEANIAEGLREVRTALLEADVNYNVVQEFMARVNERAVGAQLLKAVRADHPDALRPARLGQDDHRRQARADARGPGSQAPDGRGRPPAPCRRRAAQ